VPWVGYNNRVKKFLAPSALILALTLGASAAPDAIFDGARAFGAVAAPVTAGPRPSSHAVGKGPTEPYGEETLPFPIVEKRPAPTSFHNLTNGFLGLYPEADFELGTGRCAACRAPVEGKWYFLDDVIATPKSGPAGLVWIGSREMVDGVRISPDGKSVTLKDGTVLPFSLVAKIDSNRSFYDATSLAYLSSRTVRIRGEFVEKDGVKTLVARTIWPEDFHINMTDLKEADVKNAADVDALVAADKGGATTVAQIRSDLKIISPYTRAY